MSKKRSAILLMLTLLCSLLGYNLPAASASAGMPSGEEPEFQSMDLYVSGSEGYHTFRIPALLTTSSGTLLAFAEGRKNSASDTGDIDLVLKRSFDGGLRGSRCRSSAMPEWIPAVIQRQCRMRATAGSGCS